MLIIQVMIGSSGVFWACAIDAEASQLFDEEDCRTCPGQELW